MGTDDLARLLAKDEIRELAFISEEDEQPIPIYGWLNVYWEPVTPVAVEA